MNPLTPDELRRSCADCYAITGICFIACCTRPMQQGSSSSVGAQSLLLSGDDSDCDARLIACCEDQAVRREWRSRLIDHDDRRRVTVAPRAGSI